MCYLKHSQTLLCLLVQSESIIQPLLRFGGQSRICRLVSGGADELRRESRDEGCHGNDR